MIDLKQWLTRRAEEDKRLYEQYGKPLEESHSGEYVAIGPGGQTILGTRDVEVLQRAIDAFGSGNFAFKRVGHRAVWRWLCLLR